jgi:putative Mn2+ efflux pump MntP
MPLLGWAAGRTIADLISRYDHWVAFALLAGVGVKMIIDSVHANDDSPGTQPDVPDPTKGLSLLVLSIATSIDAFAVGLSFALLDISIMTASVIIGIVAFAMTAGGIFLGARAGKKLGRKAGILGGLILIAIGLRILLKDLI